TRVVVDATVPLAAQELLRRRSQRFVQALAVVGLRTHRRAAAGAAIDGEMDARLAELPAPDLVFAGVQANGAASGHVAPALEELAVARLPHRRDRILGDYSVQGEGVVGVDPVGKAVREAGECIRMAVWTRCGELADEALEQGAAFRQAIVV